MGTVYEKAKSEVVDLVSEIMAEHHPELVAEGVTVEVLMAWSDKPWPVKLHGYPCCAVVKNNSYKDRVEGKADATIVIDDTTVSGWPGWDDAKQRAIIDHELYHLKVDRDKQGNVKKDERGRPKLKMRLHDWELGGFAAIVERHGEAAVEAQAIAATMERHGQLLWPFAEIKGEKAKGKARRPAAVISAPKLAASTASA